MSVASSRARSASRASSRSQHDSAASSAHSNSNIQPALPPPAPAMTPQYDGRLEPCAASASFFVYAQRNVVLCLHHDTLAIERRFERHADDVVWIVVDNVSDQGAGRLVVSYDTGQIAIVWDLMTGEEVARFESYEDLRSAAWMKNGNIAFGNAVGSVILFEPSTKEHLSTRTIFDPITALAPGADNHTFAIGYQNGTIFIAKLQPNFAILHHPQSKHRRDSTLSIVGLAWHGSSSKQKSDMLASQTADGDLLVWSIPKTTLPGGESPSIIRELGNFQGRGPSQCWFGWSKTGRIVQFQEGQTLAHDVRTKRVTSLTVPTVDGVIGMANFGPTATVFSVGRGYTVQQYDINPNGTPVVVASAHHVLANLPPSPPDSVEEQRQQQQQEQQRQQLLLQEQQRAQQQQHAEVSVRRSRGHSLTQMPVFLDAASSEDDTAGMSPLAKIAQEHDDEDELRDQVPPLASPVSSKSSMTSSTRSSGRRGNYNARPKVAQPKASPSLYSQTAQSETTFFSERASTRSGASGRESVSLRSVSSTASSRHGSSRLRQEILRSPDESKATMMMDLFPFTKARLTDVDFRAPKYEGLSVDDLRAQMLSTVFAWDDDIEALIRDEHERHQPGTASAVLLSKWLGDSEADIAAAMVGSESMTSMDWMFLALSSMGNSQRKVAETFVQRLLEKGDIHPAVAILIGLGEPHDAIEVYVSRRYYMEAVLLTCLTYPRDWQRISHLVRKWGETAVAEKQADLAVRCFSCTSMEASDAYLSPRAQDAQYAAAQQHMMGALSPPLSPPDSDVSRVRPSNAGLKLVTNFNVAKASAGVGVTPIAESAMSPGGPHLRTARRLGGDSARTATPGGFGRSRLPSRSGTDRSAISEATPLATSVSALPLTAVQQSKRDAFDRPSSRHSRTSSVSGTSSVASNASNRRPSGSSGLLDVNTGAGAEKGERKSGDQMQPLPVLSPLKFKPDAKNGEAALPSPAHGVFDALSTSTASRNGSRTRNLNGLHLDMQDKVIELGPETANTGYATTEASTASRITAPSPGPPTASSMASSKIRSIDNYISSLQEANFYAQQQRVVDRERTSSRGASGRGSSRSRVREPQPTEPEPREPRGRSGVRYIRGAKHSPSSPVSMSPDDPALQLNLGTLHQMASQQPESFDDENFYRVASPIDSQPGGTRGRERSNTGGGRAPSKKRSGSKTSTTRRAESPAGSARVGGRQRSSSRAKLTVADARGRSQQRGGSHQRSPSSPLPMSAQADLYREPVADFDLNDDADVHPAHRRQRSTSRKPGPGSRSASNKRDGGSPDRFRNRERSSSRNPARHGEHLADVREEMSGSPNSTRRQSTRTASRSRMPRLQTNLHSGGPRTMTKKELAAKELEERRLSLARRPSAPAVMHPDDIERTQARSPLSTRSPVGLASPLAMDARSPAIMAEMGLSPLGFQPPRSTISTGGRYELPHSAGGATGVSTSSVPMGLPATPRAMRHPKYMTADPQDSRGDAIPAVPELPTEFLSREAEDLPTLSPVAYGGARSSTAPPERDRFVGGRRGSLGGNSSSGHVRKSSRPQVEAVDGGAADGQVIIVEESFGAPPPLLPELQHLAGPPPPPPPPSMFGNAGMISVAIEDMANLERGPTPATASTTTGSMPTLSSRATTPAAPGDMLSKTGVPNPSQSPHAHRRGRGSVGGGVSEKFRSVRDRMRSTSRNGRVKSPPLESFTPSPYESIQPVVQFPGGGGGQQHARRDSTSAADYQSMMPPPPPPVPALPSEVEGGSKSNTPFQGYRTPKDIRANMPPEQLQMGVYAPHGHGAANVI